MSKLNDDSAQNLCPICRKDNACGNLSCEGDTTACWCKSADITFPESLLQRVPKESQGKACICQSCALAHNADIKP
ncbi:MAG: cysteine-rich CWC family protein [Agarilytica sp.]